MLDTGQTACLRSAIVRNGKILNVHSFAAGGSTLLRPTPVVTHQHATSLIERETSTGTHIIENLRIFKVGTFTDMFGIEATWDDVHLDQMVAHYHILKDGGYFPDVPVKSDHSMSVKDVVGYFEDIYRDKDDPNFLSATVEITDADAWEKWDSRTWRARSIEIGFYQTNDGKTFYPVVVGLAFVDIGAVEGLHSRTRNHNTHNFHLVVTDNEETSMPPDINTQPEEWIKAVNYAAWVQSARYAQACQDWERAVNYAVALEREAAAATGAGQGQDGTQGGQGGGQPPAITGQQNHSQPPVHPPMAFRVNGQPTTDFMTVQAHIDTLEQYRSESITIGRSDYVEQLARDERITAAQIESLTAHALSLTDEQFKTFRATYDNAPKMTVFGNHGGQGPQGGENNQNQNFGSQQTTEDELETAKEIVKRHRLAGMSEDKIEKSASFKRLVAAKIDPNTI